MPMQGRTEPIRVSSRYVGSACQGETAGAWRAVPPPIWRGATRMTGGGSGRSSACADEHARPH